MNIDAVVFDYDGTLVHLTIDFGAIRQELERMASGYGVTTDGFKGLYLLELIDEVTTIIASQDGAAFRAAALALVTAREIEAARAGAVFPGVVDMLRELRTHWVKTAIITRNCDKAVKILFPDIEAHCDVYIPRDLVARAKPHPDHLTLAMSLMGVTDPSRCLMVGDHLLDIQAGRRMGLKTAGVLTGKITAEQFTQAGADYILGQATELMHHLFQEFSA